MAQLMTQTTDPFEQELARQSEVPDQARSAFRISAITAAAMVPFTLYNLYVAWLDPNWQQFAHIGLTGLVGLAGLISAWLSRWGRSGFGIMLLIGTLWLTLLLAPLTITGLGPVLALAAVLATVGLAGVGLPAKPAGRVIAGGVVIGILILGVDFYAPVDRPAVARPLLTQGIILAILAIYGLFVARQFRNYSVRAKLILAFLTVTVVAVGMVAFFNTRSTTAALEEQLGSNLHSLADSVAVSVGGELVRQIDLLQTLAANKPLQARLKLANAAGYGADSQDVQDELLVRDMIWTGAADSDNLVQSVLANSLAQQFRDIQARFPNHVEIFVTDQYGGLMAATNRTSDYYQADEAWWQAAFNNGQGAVYIGQPEFDASSNTLAVNMAVPVFDDDTGKLVGVLRTTYRLEALAELLTGVQTGYADLYMGGEVVAAGEVGLNPADPETLAQLETSAGRVYAQFPYQGVTSLVSQAPVRAITGEPVIDQLDWTVVVHQTQAEALAPVEAQTQSSLVLALVVLGLAAAVAVGMAQLLAGPISRLTRVAGQVAAGDLSARAKVESRDEIGQLAEAFNSMTGQLRETIGTLEVRVAGRTRQLETVVDVSQRLVGILDLSDLMRQVVVLIKENFGYYHVHIYLLEDQSLIMAEGYGEAGAEMKRQGHSIPLAAPKSLVARAAREQHFILVENVREDPGWLPNPLLPETYAEIAVPVMVGLDVVGVLDVQSEKVGGITSGDESALQALASQIAIAVRNARAFSQTQEALYEAQRLQRLYTSQAWEQFRAARRTTDYEFRQATVPPLQEVPTPEAAAALEQEQTITVITNGKSSSRKIAEDLTNDAAIAVEAPASNPRSALATPLRLRNEVIGVLGIHDDNPDRRWTEEEIALIEAVSEQMTLAIENARLFEHTQRDAWRNQVISETTARVWASSEIEAVMRTAVAELGEKLKAAEVVIRLGTDAEAVAE